MSPLHPSHTPGLISAAGPSALHRGPAESRGPAAGWGRRLAGLAPGRRLRARAARAASSSSWPLIELWHAAGALYDGHSRARRSSSSGQLIAPGRRRCCSACALLLPSFALPAASALAAAHGVCRALRHRRGRAAAGLQPGRQPAARARRNISRSRRWPRPRCCSLGQVVATPPCGRSFRLLGHRASAPTTLRDAFDITPGEMIGLVGAGGKTTTLQRPARRVAGRRPHRPRPPAPCICSSSKASRRTPLWSSPTWRCGAALPPLLAAAGHVRVAASGCGDKICGLDPADVTALKGLPGLDHVLVEADGARHIARSRRRPRTSP